jgi:hypothetical protein
VRGRVCQELKFSGQSMFRQGRYDCGYRPMRPRRLACFPIQSDLALRTGGWRGAG